MATISDNIVHLPGGWTLESLSSFEPNSNPFRQDSYSMGQTLANGLVMMSLNHTDEDAKPFYLVDKPSGSRIRIYPPGTYSARQDSSLLPDFERGCVDGMSAEDALLAAQLKKAIITAGENSDD